MYGSEQGEGSTSQKKKKKKKKTKKQKKKKPDIKYYENRPGRQVFWYKPINLF